MKKKESKIKEFCDRHWRGMFNMCVIIQVIGGFLNAYGVLDMVSWMTFSFFLIIIFGLLIFNYMVPWDDD